MTLTNATNPDSASNASYNIVFNQLEWLTLLNTTLHNDNNISMSCPYLFVSLESHHCQAFSRKNMSLEERFSHLLHLQHEYSILYPILNCSYKGEGLPRFIYLDKSNLFNFTVKFHLSTLIKCPNITSEFFNLELC